jgi:hypothetical protein
LKYGLLHLSSGVELLFKEALRREHWSLIFRDPDQATAEALESGDFSSADFDSCLKRLENIAGAKLSKTERTELLSVRRKRNRLEHFGIADSNEAVIASSAHLMSTVVDFMRERLEPDQWDQSCKKYLEDIMRKLSDFKELVHHRNDDIQNALKQARETGAVFVCSLCLQNTLALGDRSQVRCLFCRYQAKPSDAADFWVGTALGITRYEVEKEGGAYPIHECPECGEETLVDTDDFGETFGLQRYVCFACGNFYEESPMRYCETCGKLYNIQQTDDYGMCSTCLENLKSRWDKA